MKMLSMFVVFTSNLIISHLDFRDMDMHTHTSNVFDL